MSLVANYSDSEEESENEAISDAEDSQPTIISKIQANGVSSSSTSDGKLRLPKPMKAGSPTLDESKPDTNNTFKINLPKPSKALSIPSVEEEDDEFLHKSASSFNVEKPPGLKNTKVRQPVKISIPSLNDVGDDFRKKEVSVAQKPVTKVSGLMNLLPPPKLSLGINSNFKISTPANSSDNSAKSSMIPHSVKKQIDSRSKALKASATVTSSKSIKQDSSDSDDSDAEDFFSLNDESKLPEVSANEIQNMVARKTAKLAEASKKIERHLMGNSSIQEEEASIAEDRLTAVQSEAAAIQQRELDIQALCGSRAKRARKEDINFIEISHEEVLPNRDEWLRSQLTATTEYQPRGLVGFDDPGSGTKKKHQITYLAYQAKANEQELEAMWAANRNSRRQTQSKYGF